MVAMLVSLVLAAEGGAGGKLAPGLAREMAEVIVAVDRSLGLESWPTHGAKPCVERGGPDNPTKDVSRDDTLRCAREAIDKRFGALGRSYVLAVIMAPMGPVTVVALGTAEAEGWAAYSCDPGRKCPPLRMSPTTKWGKRLLERQAKACSDETTIWFPEGQRACPR
jgi:NAD(P)-dependent dehydrogenase (short-subunit alcohol dehydrogenase family)